jgi:adenylate kinase
LLDGYPRTIDQADFLLDLARAAGTKLDLVLLVENDDDTIVRRTVGRRICPNKSCGRVFHVIHKPPTPEGTCTNCGTPVVHRSDDTEEKVRTRLAEFQTKALPALNRLLADGIPLVRVPGNLPVFSDEAVEESVLSAVMPLIGAG